MEIWNTVPSAPHYEASSLGRVRRVPFVRPMPHGGLRMYGGKPWFGVWEKRQQRYILRCTVLKKTLKVARMVCEAFHGPPPPFRTYCLHIDEDGMNNRPGNLTWGTQLENLNHPKVKDYHVQACARKMSGETVDDLPRSRPK